MLKRVRSIRLKVMLTVLATTVAAVLLAGTVLVLYDIRSHRESWGRDLMIQAEIVGRTSAPAIVFGDTLTAHQSLAMLAIRPEIRAAAVYTKHGDLFATYASGDAVATSGFPPVNAEQGFRYVHDRLELFKPIEDLDGRVGTVYLSARYDLGGRLARYLPVVAIVALGSVIVAFIMSYGLQSSVTKPVLAIAEVAHQVRTNRNYALRVRRDTNDETGELVEAFNAMLGEVDEAQRSLLEANERKDVFLATLAHELRNPLGPVWNAVQYLRLKDNGDGVPQQSLDVIERQVQHMVRLIEDLLDISRINRDALELRFSDFTVGDLVRDVVEAIQYAVEESGQQLHRHVDHEAVVVHADRARLVQVVNNLLHNAIKYTPEDGRIDLSVTTQGPELVITITDTGIGIPADRLNDIFEPFSQVDRSIERTRGGLGIGLALAQRLVGLHRGRVTASSQGLGKGSTFRITLPVVTEAPAAAVAAEPSTTAAPMLKVLVADDNVDGAETLAMLLDALGHRVSVAHDGMEAFEQLSSGSFDVAILDIGMPRLNGYDLARRIREQPWGRAVRLVALTGWGQLDDRKRAYDAGFEHHLTKPVGSEKLTAVLTVVGRGASAGATSRPAAADC